MSFNKFKILIFSVGLSLSAITTGAIAQKNDDLNLSNKLEISCQKKYSELDIEVFLNSFTYKEEGMKNLTQDDLDILKQSFSYKEEIPNCLDDKIKNMRTNTSTKNNLKIG